MIRESITVPGPNLFTLFACFAQVMEDSDVKKRVQKAVNTLDAESLGPATEFAKAFFNGFITDQELAVAATTLGQELGISTLEQDRLFISMKILRQQLGLASDDNTKSE